MRSLWTFSIFLQLLKDIRTIEVSTHVPAAVATRLPEAVRLLNETRRIIEGSMVQDSRPYMVHLKLPNTNEKSRNYKKWLCGGVIVHEDYILTSAACIEDVQHFYVVSGTYKYADEDDRYNNPCIKNGAKKAIWKCVPKNYVFDGHENDNIRWMNNDIAVVKVDEGFDFTRRVRGCEFVPKPICYNNQSTTLESPGTTVSIAGWGTTDRYNDWVSRRSDVRIDNQPMLLEAGVEIITKQRCKNRWGARYHNIIDNYMICTKDIGQSMSEICNEKYVECEDINYYNDDDLNGRRSLLKTEKVPVNMMMHSALHNETYSNGTRRYQTSSLEGGFCENDHGGPLVYGSGVNSVVIGIISACLVKEKSNKCYGPFLYTSVYKNRQFISCSLYKDIEPKCRRQFRSGVTHEEKVLSWNNHPDGPAKFETPKEKVANAKLPPEAVPVQPAASEPAASVPATSGQVPAKTVAAEQPIQLESIYVANNVVQAKKKPAPGEPATATEADKVFSNAGFVMRTTLNDSRQAKKPH